jgi:hypothetical protein
MVQRDEDTRHIVKRVSFFLSRRLAELDYLWLPSCDFAVNGLLRRTQNNGAPAMPQLHFLPTEGIPASGPDGVIAWVSIP